MKQIRAIQIGCGKISKYIMKYLRDRGGKIVGAVDNNSNILGMDIGEIVESKKTKVIVNDISKLEELLKETKPNVAIIATKSSLEDIENCIRICVKNGVNVITTSEECFYPLNSNFSLYKELDILAKAYDVRIMGSGFQDVFLGNLINNIVGCNHNVREITAKIVYNLEEDVKNYGIGLSWEEFQKLSSERQKPHYLENVGYWLADKLKLTIKKVYWEEEAIIADKDIFSEALNLQIKKGMVRGINWKVFVETNEDITIMLEVIGQVFEDEEVTMYECSVIGEAKTTICADNIDIRKLASADIVNRIKDLLEAPAGFGLTTTLREISYRGELTD